VRLDPIGKGIEAEVWDAKHAAGRFQHVSCQDLKFGPQIQIDRREAGRSLDERHQGQFRSLPLSDVRNGI